MHELRLRIQQLRQRSDHIDCDIAVTAARFDQSAEPIVFVQGVPMRLQYGHHEVAETTIRAGRSGVDGPRRFQELGYIHGAGQLSLEHAL